MPLFRVIFRVCPIHANILLPSTSSCSQLSFHQSWSEYTRSKILAKRMSRSLSDPERSLPESRYIPSNPIALDELIKGTSDSRTTMLESITPIRELVIERSPIVYYFQLKQDPERELVLFEILARDRILRETRPLHTPLKSAQKLVDLVDKFEREDILKGDHYLKTRKSHIYEESWMDEALTGEEKWVVQLIKTGLNTSEEHGDIISFQKYYTEKNGSKRSQIIIVHMNYMSEFREMLKLCLTDYTKYQDGWRYPQHCVNMRTKVRAEELGIQKSDAGLSDDRMPYVPEEDYGSSEKRMPNVAINRNAHRSVDRISYVPENKIRFSQEKISYVPEGDETLFSKEKMSNGPEDWDDFFGIGYPTEDKSKCN